MAFESAGESGEGFFVEAEEEFRRGRRGEVFIEEKFEGRMGNFFEAEGWFAHFADAAAEGGDMFGAVMSMETEGALEFVNRLGSEAGGEDLGETLEDVVIALEAGDALLDGKPGLHGLLEGAKARKRRKVLVGRVFHGGMLTLGEGLEQTGVAGMGWYKAASKVKSCAVE